eukprot:10436700-Alexandrium_andersonii.AAC.1
MCIRDRARAGTEQHPQSRLGLQASYWAVTGQLRVSYGRVTGELRVDGHGQLRVSYGSVTGSCGAKHGHETRVMAVA